MSSPACPDESRLCAFLRGELEPAEAERIGRHVEGCAECGRRAETWRTRGDSGTGGPASASASASPSGEATDDATDRSVSPGNAPSTVARPGSSWESTRDATRGAGFEPVERPRDLDPGTPIRYFGDYEVEAILGRGGMGVVYRARQVSLNRPVALKMIKAGMLADETELRRFQNEAEAVALLDHPGVVPVYEVGDHDGQRYFSMRLVEGGNLSSRLSVLKKDPRAAAALLAETAEAVHHAHMRGILHRDLKPANILVDAEGHPHVTDFGLAKRVEGDAEMTQSGAILGTPAYMSPEQAHGRRGSITTATDVYGLGAILYATLTGRAPFGGESVIETLDAVRTRLPEPPSKFNDGTPRDLETICLKCLDKDPRRRYASAQAMADDLRNWLGSRPISARRVGPAERAWLWCKRKPAVAALAASTLIALVGGTAGVIAVQARAYRDLKSANERLDEQRLRAEANEGLAIEAVKRFGAVVTNEPELKNAPGLAPLRQRLLKEPRAFFRELRGRLQAGGDTRPETLHRLVDADFDLGDLTNEIGDKQDALASYREALAICRKLVEAEPSSIKYRIDLAQSHHNIGMFLAATGKTAEALSEDEDAAALWRELLRDDPSASALFRRHLASTLNNIGSLRRITGKPAEALKAHREARTIRQELADADPGNARLRADLAQSLHNLGLVLGNTGKPAEALKDHQDALAIQKALAESNPSVVQYRRELAMSTYSLGSLLRELGKPAEALKAHKDALAIRKGVAEAEPSAIESQNDLATSYHTVGVLLKQSGQRAEALKSYQAALTIQEALAEANPTVTTFRRDVANTYYNIGLLQWAMGQPAEALKSYEAALPIRKELAEANPTQTDLQNDLAAVHNNMANPLWSAGKQAEAKKEFEAAAAILEGLVKAHPEMPEFASGLGTTLSNIAAADLEAKRFAEARDRLGPAIALQKKALVAFPDHPAYRSYLADSLERLEQAARGLGDASAAAEARAERTRLRDSDPKAVALDARLSAVIQGKQAPKNVAERLALAQRASETGLHASAARLWGEALDANPKLGDDRRAGVRYNASCAAALAAGEQGRDDPKPDAPARQALRQKALGWLRAELDAWTGLLDASPKLAGPVVIQALTHWKQDPDLAGLRDEKATAPLPDDQKAEIRKLWADVEALIARAGAPRS